MRIGSSFGFHGHNRPELRQKREGHALAANVIFGEAVPFVAAGYAMPVKNTIIDVQQFNAEDFGGRLALWAVHDFKTFPALRRFFA